MPMPNDEKQRFYLAVSAMEDEGPAPPLDPALEDRLVHGVLSEIRAEKRRRARRWAAGSLLAMAACLLLLLWPRGGALPGYIVEVSRDQVVLGNGPPAPDTPPRLSPGSVLDVKLRPVTHYAGRVRAAAFVRQGGALHTWEVQLAPVPQAPGALHLRARVNELPLLRELPPGPVELIFALGTSGSGPDAVAVDQALHRGAETVGGWRLIRQPIVIRGP